MTTMSLESTTNCQNCKPENRNQKKHFGNADCSLALVLLRQLTKEEGNEGTWIVGGLRTNTANKYSTRELKSRRVQWKSLVSNALSPFIFENSVRFADELEAFLVSGLDIATYDEQVLRRSATGNTSSCSSGKELSSKDASGSYVPSQHAFNAKGGKSKEGTRVNLFDLLDEDVDLIAENNTGA